MIDVADAPFDIQVEARGTTVHVTVEGELDLATAPHLCRVVAEAMNAQTVETLVIDLGPLGFTDSSGLHAIDDLHRRCTDTGTRLVILPAADEVHQPFAITGLDAVLPFVPGARRSAA